VQALLEVDAYRLLALLAFPVARELSPVLNRNERELSEIANVLVNADPESEPVLLDRLTRLQADIERHEADNHYRFGAAEAYYTLVQRRTSQLREERVAALQTFQEFMERRLGPAMNTCAAISARLESLSQRVTRATQLLSTRIEITRERQNQQLLESMNRRAETQLRLQATVEGLSVAAVSSIMWPRGCSNPGCRSIPRWRRRSAYRLSRCSCGWVSGGYGARLRRFPGASE
jgi:uncharacterized membrane-anchored protein